MRRRALLIPFVLLAACATPSSPTDTIDPEPFLTLTLTDPASDWVIAPAEGPPSIVPYAPADVTSVRLGVSGSYLYVQVNYAANIPTAPVNIPAQAGMPAQVVREQGFSLDFNMDGDERTGAGAWPVINGVDIFFALRVDYGDDAEAYANFDFTGNDVHFNRGHVTGTIVAGGAGTNSLTARFDVSALGAFFPRGRAVVVGAWSEAESSDAGGRTIYHHFAYDPVPAVPWTTP